MLVNVSHGVQVPFSSQATARQPIQMKPLSPSHNTRDYSLKRASWRGDHKHLLGDGHVIVVDLIEGGSLWQGEMDCKHGSSLTLLGASDMLQSRLNRTKISHSHTVAYL